jgi:hypothetical protein
MGLFEGFALLFVIVWVVCAFDVLGREDPPPGWDENEYEGQTWVCPSCGIAIDPNSEACPWCGFPFYLTEDETAPDDVEL